MKRKKLLALTILVLALASSVLIMIIDADQDGLSTWRELFQTRTNPFVKDTDSDGLNDGEEISYGTPPLIEDTDGDGLLDGEEVHIYGTNPLVKDTDQDGIDDFHEIKLGTNPLNPDTDGDGLLDRESFPLDLNRPQLDIVPGSVNLVRNGWAPQITVTYEITGDNESIPSDWIHNQDVVFSRLDWQDFRILVNGIKTSFVPQLYGISVPINLSSTVEVNLQYRDNSINQSYLAERTNWTAQTVNEYWIDKTVPVEQQTNSGLNYAVNSMQATFDDYAFVMSGLIMMQRHIQDLKNMLDWDSSYWSNLLAYSDSAFNINAPLQTVLSSLETLVANRTSTYINDLKMQVQKVWVDLQALKKLPWDYVASYAVEEPGVPSYLLESVTSYILSSQHGLSWLDVLVGGGIGTLQGIFTRLCSDYFDWINDTSPVVQMKYAAGSAKWYIDNLDKIRKVDRWSPPLSGPIGVLDYDGELVLPWFPAKYAFDVTESWDWYKTTSCCSVGQSITKLQFENFPIHFTGLSLGPSGETKTYETYLATESKVQEYLQKYGFWVPHLPPTKTEQNEFAEIRNASKFLLTKLDSDQRYFVGTASLGGELKITANSYGDFSMVDEALAVLREYKTVENLLNVVNQNMWHLES
jgi:hypothetical protein